MRQRPAYTAGRFRSRVKYARKLYGMDDFQVKPVADDPDKIEFEHTFQLEGKADSSVVTELDDGDLLIEGYASVFAGLDRQNENFVEGAFQRGIKSFLDRKTKPLCYHHKRDQVLGEIVDLEEVEGKGLWMKARVDKQVESSPLYHLYNGIKKGSISGLSVGGHFARQRVNGRPMIANCDIIEISATAAPVHPDTSWAASREQ
jgi:HK97 family phage prohead protease